MKLYTASLLWNRSFIIEVEGLSPNDVLFSSYKDAVDDWAISDMDNGGKTPRVYVFKIERDLLKKAMRKNAYVINTNNRVYEIGYYDSNWKYHHKIFNILRNFFAWMKWVLLSFCLLYSGISIIYFSLGKIVYWIIFVLLSLRFVFLILKQNKRFREKLNNILIYCRGKNSLYNVPKPPRWKSI